MKKKIIQYTTGLILGLLLFCTVASVQVQKLLLPQVIIDEIKPGIVIVDGVEKAFEYTVPLSAIDQDGDHFSVFYLQKWDGAFGEEYRAQRTGVTVLATDIETAALSEWKYGKSVIINSDKKLVNSIRVLIKD